MKKANQRTIIIKENLGTSNSDILTIDFTN